MPRKTIREERDEVANFAQGLSDEFLQCRNLGHAWSPLRAEFRSKERAYYVAYLCSRCQTERYQWLDRRGGIVSGSYDYPDGYTHTRQGRISSHGRAELRLEQLGRVIRLVGDND